MRYFKHTLHLTLKNLKIIVRNRKYLLFYLLSPLIVITYITLYQKAFDRMIQNNTKRDFPEKSLSGIPKCVGPDGCLTLGYFVLV